MKVTILQTDIVWASPEENVKNAQRLIDEHPGSDIYVLPEMWATGFAVQSKEAAEDEQSAALQWMQLVASQNNCAVSGSLLIRTMNGSYKNRHYFVTADSICHYDKHHLFTYGGEDDYITPGNEHVVVSYHGRRFLLLTCYDLRFPVWARFGYAGHYDAIIVVANWPESRQQAWRVLTRARAIENQCYVIAANRVGDDPNCHYIGESLVAGPKGDTLGECAADRVDTLTVTLDFERLATIRQRFKVLDDRDQLR